MNRNLLTDNDLHALQTALRRMEHLTLTRTLESLELTVSVLPVGKAWPVAMAVQVRKKTGRVECVQTFESLEAAGKAWT